MRKAITTLAAMSALLTACSNSADVEKEIAAVEEELAETVNNNFVSQKRRELARFERTDELFLGFAKVDTRYGDPLPVDWKKDIHSLSFTTAVDIQTVARALRLELGVPVRINDRMPNMTFNASDGVSVTSADASGDQARNQNNPDDERSLADQELQNDRSSPIKGPFTLQPRGTWEEILNIVAATFEVAWRYEDGRLVFDYYETEDFTIKTVAVDIKNNINVGEASGGAEGEGISASTKQTLEASQDINLFNNIANGLAARLPQDSRIVPQPGTQTISVAAPAYVMPRIRDYIEWKNMELGRQIAFHLDVFSVTLSDESKSRFGLNLAYQDLQNRFGFNIQGVGPRLSDAGASMSTGAVLTPPVGSTLSRFTGTEIVAEAFNKVGKVSIVYQDDKLAPNYIPVKFELQNQIDFVCERNLATLGEGQQNPVQETKLCTESNGFKLNLLANIHEDGSMNIQISSSVSELLALDQLGTPENFLERPNRNVGDLYFQGAINSGDIVVISGYQQRTKRVTETDGGQVICTIMCTSDDAATEVRKLYFVVRPVVLAPTKALRAATQ